jgi:hypothetical protein
LYKNLPKKKNKIQKGGASRSRVKKIRKHKDKGSENDERENGTICSAKFGPKTIIK